MAGKRTRASNTSSPPATDDFKRIRGIGLAAEHRLHKAGIHRFAQLATLSADQIAARIGGISAKRILRENWIGQARQLARPLASGAGRKKAEIRRQSHRRKSAPLGAAPQHYATFTVQLTLDAAGHLQRGVCTHHQSKDQETWNKNDWDETKLMTYVIRKAGLHPVQAPATTPPTQPASTSLIDLTSQPILPHHRKILATPVEAQTPPASIEDTTLPVPDIRAAASTEDFAAKTIPAEAESARVVEPGKTRSGETMHLSGLTTMLLDSDHSSRVLPADTPFRVQLSVEPTEVKDWPDVPVDLATFIHAKRMGGARQLIGEARDVAKLGVTANVKVDCLGLSPGDYRLEAEVSLMRHSGRPQSSDIPAATLVSSFLHIY